MQYNGQGKNLGLDARADMVRAYIAGHRRRTLVRLHVIFRAVRRHHAHGHCGHGIVVGLPRWPEKSPLRILGRGFHWRGGVYGVAVCVIG